jgi:prepilin-type processing-associated H-X9-DG protein
MSEEALIGRFRVRDLMVIVALAGLVLGVVLSLLNRAHETERRLYCVNNLRSLATGLVDYASRNNRFPNAVTIGDHPDGAFTRQIDSPNLSIAPAGSPGNGLSHDLGPLHSWVADVIPGLDQSTLYDEWDHDRVHFDPVPKGGGTTRPSNARLGRLSFFCLLCPDERRKSGEGSLSYAVNMGIVRWAGVPESADDTARVWASGWSASPLGGSPNRFTWGTNHYALVKKTGVMFTGTPEGNAPWDMHHSLTSIADGTSTTVMVAENTLGGASAGGGRYGWTLAGVPVPTNWTAAHPNYVGFIASNAVCGVGPLVDCSRQGDLAPVGQQDGPGWARSNSPNQPGSLDYGRKHGHSKGASPFPNSGHPEGIPVAFCDGSVRVIPRSIDGRIWSKLITPDGESLTPPFGQLPLGTGDLPD